MDAYTLKTKAWLETRYQRVNSEGIYQAHQPIYGYMNGNCDDGDYITCYNRIYHTLRALKSINGCSTLLDVGASEGFTAHLANKLLGFYVSCCDLSENACKMAAAIFRLPARQADIHNLPYVDESFDVVLCNETLEHLTNPYEGAKELMRVAKTAVVITVPHEPIEKIEQNRESGEEHAHINSFTLSSFDQVAAECGFEIGFCKAFQHKSTSALGRWLVWPGKPYTPHARFPKAAYIMYRWFAGVVRYALGQRLPSWAISRDATLFSRYNSEVQFGCLLFILVRKGAHSINSLKAFDSSDLVKESVSFFYPNQN